MTKLCYKCGEIREDNTGICESCGELYSTELDVKDVPEQPLGKRVHVLTAVSVTAAMTNLILGPVATFIVIYNPMLPTSIFRVVSFNLAFYYMILVPVVALVCLALNKLAKLSYRPEKHTPKNLKLAHLSYKFSLWAVILWIVLILVGLGITLTNLI